MEPPFEFESRRSVVVCRHGCVASSNPLASQAGLDILKAGGNAADAAVAVTAALAVMEPTSTGLGGDAFCMFYDRSSKSVKGLNGSGRSSAAATIERLRAEGYDDSHHYSAIHGHSVTVPGAAAAMVDTVTHFGSGKLSLSEILRPAIEMAEVGFPVQELTAAFWARVNLNTEATNSMLHDHQSRGSPLCSYLDYVINDSGAPNLQRKDNIHGCDLLLNGQAPGHGDIMRNPHLAKTLKELAVHGKKGFYQGRIARAVADVVHQHSGLVSYEDMAAHESTFDEPISTDYKGCRVWELPPNGQGMAALLALNILEDIDLKSMGHNSAEYLHYLIESLRLAFADTMEYCADQRLVDIPIDILLSKDYAAKQRHRISPDRIIPVSSLRTSGLDIPVGSDTVYFTTADRDGNACSYINSNFIGFGTAIVPEGCGFSLQNRGHGFSLNTNHRNVLAPRKRPFHTIIPSMVTSTDTNELLMSFGVMGGYMQPQGHVQVLLNMLEFQNNPQTALDLPRICLGAGVRYSKLSTDILAGTLVEKGITDDVMLKLSALGHNITQISGLERATFGRGQVITNGSWWRDGFIDPAPSVYWAGSDPRADGLVAAY